MEKDDYFPQKKKENNLDLLPPFTQDRNNLSIIPEKDKTDPLSDLSPSPTRPIVDDIDILSESSLFELKPIRDDSSLLKKKTLDI